MTQILDSLIVEGDASIQSFVLPATSTATTLNGTLTLTNTSSSAQILTGTATGFSVVLPDATTIPQGQDIRIYNTTTKTVTIKMSGGAVIFTLAQNSTGYLYLQAAGSTGGTWLSWQIISDPSLASGIINYNVNSSTPFATTSPTDILITGFTLTPAAGTYAVWYSADVVMAATPQNHQWSIYKANALVADSKRTQISSRSNQSMFDMTMTTVTVDGTQAIDVRVHSASGTLTVNSRSLILIRLGT